MERKINPEVNISFSSKNHIENDQPLYRVIPLNRLHWILLNNKLTFTLTKSWEDVYENFLLKSSFHYGVFKNQTLTNYQDTLYGLCFSTKRESDAMWRIYSHDKTSVRIRTNLNSIINMLKNGPVDSPYRKLEIRIGEVEYPFKNELIRRYNSMTEDEILDNFNAHLLNSMFLKRNEFSHEKEFRIIIRGLDPQIKSTRELPDFLFFPIDPDEFIDSIAFDPRLGNIAYRTNKEVLLKIGYSKNILRTSLYRFEELSFKRNDKKLSTNSDSE